MSALADLLPEPADETTVVLDFGEHHDIVRRMDETARDFTDHADERWMSLADADRDPMTWRAATEYATRAYALGEALADTEAD